MEEFTHFSEHQELMYLMIRPLELESLDMGQLCKGFPKLEEVRVFMGGIDFDFRSTPSDMQFRHVEVDLQDVAMTSQVTRLAEIYQDFCRDRYVCSGDISTVEEWRHLVDQNEAPSWYRNEDWAMEVPKEWEYYSLDKAQQNFLPLEPLYYRTWPEHCHFQERNFLGHERWLQLAGNPEDVRPLQLRIAHTREYYEALEGMPKMRRMAVVRLLGDVGDLWIDHAVEVGKTKKRPASLFRLKPLYNASPSLLSGCRVG
jgi:hypothetical protein